MWLTLPAGGVVGVGVGVVVLVGVGVGVPVLVGLGFGVLVVVGLGVGVGFVVGTVGIGVKPFADLALAPT